MKSDKKENRSMKSFCGEEFVKKKVLGEKSTIKLKFNMRTVITDNKTVEKKFMSLTNIN